MKSIETLRPFTRFCCTIGNLPTSYMESLTYEEQLIWLCNYLENVVIPAVNNNAEAVKELQDLYVVLKDYVDNYFNNLDVQEEINNKLDAMVASGELEEILTSLLSNITGNYIIADNYQTLEEAFNAANTSYGLIYLSPGKTYIINESITLNNNVSIIGNGAKIISNVENDYVIKYKDPVSPNNWDLFESYKIENLIFDCKNISLGAISIDRLHYPTLDNIKIENNNGYALKLKTVYWGTFSNIHIQKCNGGGIQLCGTTINSGYTGSNQNTFINCSVLDYNKAGNYYGIQIIERSNQNNFNQITVQNSKDNNNDYGIGLYIKNAVNNTFINFYAESQKVNVWVESGDDGTQSQASFYTPYFGIDEPTQCCLYCKDSKANIYNPFYYENTLKDGYNKSMFVSHHTSGHLSFIHIETDKPVSSTSQNKLLCYYDGTTYTDYKAVPPTSGNFGTVFSKAPYNDNTFNIIFRSTINPLYVDNMKITSDTVNNVLQLYRYGMFGNQNGTYAIQPTLAGNLQQLPTQPVNGLTYFETNNKKLLTYYNGHWYYADGTIYS